MINLIISDLNYPTVKIYLNGNLVVSGTMSANCAAAGNFPLSSGNLYYANGGTPENIDFEIEQVRIFNKAITQDEVATLFNEIN